MVVTSIKDIPNFKQRLNEGKITYRGLGMGKLAADFYKLSGDDGTRIKVDGKEYFITDTEFDTFSRGKDGLMRIRFDAPYRKGADGGMMANGGITVIESSPRSEYEDYEMLVISKDAEKDGGGFHKHRYLVSAKNIQEAKEIATRMFEEDSRLSDYYFYEVMSEERYRMFYMDKFAKGGVVGDAARVKSKNKTGVIMKVFKADDFEKFSDIKPEKNYLIKFVDGTQDTYAKSELEFYKFSD